MRLSVVLAVLVLLVTQAVSAKNLSYNFLLSAGLSSHDMGYFTVKKEDGVDLHLNLQLSDNQYFLNKKLSLRPTVGMTLNSANKSHVGYLGMTYNYQLPRLNKFFFEGFHGLGFHTGDSFNTATEEIENGTSSKKNFGCPFLVKSILGLGYQYNAKWAVKAWASHLSHGKVLCLSDKNPGMDQTGIDLSFKF